MFQQRSYVLPKPLFISDFAQRTEAFCLVRGWGKMQSQLEIGVICESVDSFWPIKIRKAQELRNEKQPET
jgi:hypothetical protein